MKKYTVVLDKIKDVGMGDKDIIEGENSLDAARKRFPDKEIQKTYGEDYNFSLLEVTIDRFNRCFLNVKAGRKNFIVK